MNLYNVLLNNEIPFVLHESSDLENVIYCKSFSDYLFNVGTFTTKTKEVILEYITEDDRRYIIADVTFENGECYKNVKFEVIIDEDIETPYSTINLNLLENKTQVVIPQKPQQIVENVEEVVEELESTPVPIVEPPDYTETINEALRLQKKLSKEKEEIRKQKILLEKQDVVKDKVQKIKNELLEEYFNAVKKQEEILNVSIDKNLASLEDRLVQTLERYSDQYAEKAEELKSDTKDFIKIQEANILHNLSQKIENKIDEQKKEIEVLIGSELSFTQTEIVSKLEETSQKLVELYKDKTFVMLEQYKQDLLEEYSTVAQQKADDFFNKKGQTINFELKKLTESIEELQLLKDVKKEVIQEVKLYVDEASQSARAYARRILDLGGGGGSVAVQYAEGGTMNGDLTVNGKVTANSLVINDDVTICGDILPCQTDTYNLGSSALRWKDLHLAGNSLYIGDSVITAIGTTIVVPTQEVDGNMTVLDGDVEVTGGNYLSAGINLLDIFGSSQSVTIIAGNSAKWDSTYTTVNLNSGSWVTYSYANNNFLALTGGRIAGDLTITGNLTALGTSTFRNTIFTTTSALSVVNLGPGPALYVYQASGPYDVASFYDGDGIEVLHVGNAQPNGLGRVGINESYPGAELTVNGNISGNGSISVISMQASNNVGVGTYAPLYFNLDVNGPTGNGSIGSSYGNLSIGSSSDILINPNNNLVLGPVGNVGVGTTAPSVKLTVNGAISSNETIFTIDGNSTNWNSTYTTVNAYSASWEETLDIIPTVTNYLSTNNVFLSAARVTDNINVGGTGYFRHIAASTKSFYIPHPLDSSKHLQYGSLESPYHGVRLTGKDKIQKECYIILPNYIKSLVQEDGVNVQITNINHTQQLYVKRVDIDNNCIVIGRKYNLLNKNEFYEFYWSFTAIRKDIPNLQTEI